MPEQIEIRDLRKQDWIWTSKTLLFHPSMDGNTYKVYCGLASYSDNRTQEAFPSIETLASKLHMGRSTVIRALQKCEGCKIISVERAVGTHNVYTLLDIVVEQIPKRANLPPSQATPGNIAREFFKGVADLREKIESLEGSMVKNLLLTLTAKYPLVPKGIMWNEVKAFEQYWTELNKTGTKQRWESEPAFQIERRIVTWFGKKKEFAQVGSVAKGSKVATL